MCGKRQGFRSGPCLPGSVVKKRIRFSLLLWHFPWGSDLWPVYNRYEIMQENYQRALGICTIDQLSQWRFQCTTKYVGGGGGEGEERGRGEGGRWRRGGRRGGEREERACLKLRLMSRCPPLPQTGRERRKPVWQDPSFQTLLSARHVGYFIWNNHKKGSISHIHVQGWGSASWQCGSGSIFSHCGSGSDFSLWCVSRSCSTWKWCESATTGIQILQGSIFEPQRFHCEPLMLLNFYFNARIQLPKIMRFCTDPNPLPCQCKLTFFAIVICTADSHKRKLLHVWTSFNKLETIAVQ